MCAYVHVCVSVCICEHMRVCLGVCLSNAMLCTYVRVRIERVCIQEKESELNEEVMKKDT